jgi:hypothetical protein
MEKRTDGAKQVIEIMALVGIVVLGVPCLPLGPWGWPILMH